MMFYDDLAEIKYSESSALLQYQTFCVRAQSVKCIEELTEGERKPVWKSGDV